MVLDKVAGLETGRVNCRAFWLAIAALLYYQGARSVATLLKTIASLRPKLSTGASLHSGQADAPRESAISANTRTKRKPCKEKRKGKFQKKRVSYWRLQRLGTPTVGRRRRISNACKNNFPFFFD